MASEDDGRGAERAGLPAWLMRDEAYEPPRERGSFVTKSLLGMTGVLARMRLDDGRDGPLSPSAPPKLLLGLATILLTSLSRNYASCWWCWRSPLRAPRCCPRGR